MGLTTVVGMNQTQDLKQLDQNIEDYTTCNYNSQIEGREIMIKDMDKTEESKANNLLSPITMKSALTVDPDLKTNKAASDNGDVTDQTSNRPLFYFKRQNDKLNS